MQTIEIMNMIKKHEGKVLEVYEDSEGVLTVGYGHALHVGSKIPETVADLLFAQDYRDAADDCVRFCGEHQITFLNPVRKAVLINMLFNMGYKRVSGFKKMIKYLKAEDYPSAALEMLDSKWATQVKGRAYELANIMERGEIV